MVYLYCKSLFLYFNNLVSVTLGEPKVHVGTCRQLTQTVSIDSHHPFHSNMFSIILHHISVSLNTLFAILGLQSMRVQNWKRAYGQYCWYNPVLKWYINISWNLFLNHICIYACSLLNIVRVLAKETGLSVPLVNKFLWICKLHEIDSNLELCYK